MDLDERLYAKILEEAGPRYFEVGTWMIAAIPELSGKYAEHVKLWEGDLRPGGILTIDEVFSPFLEELLAGHAPVDVVDRCLLFVETLASDPEQGIRDVAVEAVGNMMGNKEFLKRCPRMGPTTLLIIRDWWPFRNPHVKPGEADREVNKLVLKFLARPTSRTWMDEQERLLKSTRQSVMPLYFEVGNRMAAAFPELSGRVTEVLNDWMGPPPFQFDGFHTVDGIFMPFLEELLAGDAAAEPIDRCLQFIETFASDPDEGIRVVAWAALRTLMANEKFMGLRSRMGAITLQIIRDFRAEEPRE